MLLIGYNVGYFRRRPHTVHIKIILYHIHNDTQSSNLKYLQHLAKASDIKAVDAGSSVLINYVLN